MGGTKPHHHSKYLPKGHGPTWLIRNGTPYCATSVMLRRSALPKHGFESRLRNVSDHHLYIETLIEGGEYGYIPGVYAKYRRHSGNITNQRDRMTDEIEYSLELLANSFISLRNDCHYAKWSLVSYGRGINAMLRGDLHLARTFFLENISNIPFHLKSWLRLLQTTYRILRN